LRNLLQICGENRKTDISSINRSCKQGEKAGSTNHPVPRNFPFSPAAASGISDMDMTGSTLFIFFPNVYGNIF